MNFNSDEMKEYRSASPEFSDAIKVLDTDTPNHAEGVNVATRQLLDNTVVLKNELACNLLYLEDMVNSNSSGGIVCTGGNVHCNIPSKDITVWSGEIALPEGGYVYSAQCDSADVIVVYTLDGGEYRAEISAGAVLPEGAVVTEYRLERKEGESRIVADIWPMISPGKRPVTEYVPYTGDERKINRCVAELAAPKYEMPEKRQPLSPGERIRLAFGKIGRYLSDLKDVAFSGSYNDLADKPSATDIGAVKKTGDTMTGNLTVDPSDGEAQVNVRRSTGRAGRLVASSSDNFGLYDETYSKWLIKSDADGNVSLNGTATNAANAANATNTDKIDGFHASSFLGNGTGYVCPPKLGANLSDLKTEYHGFVFNCPNSPADYGFLDVTYFDGSSFSPYGTGAVPVVRQIFTKWDDGKMWSRTCVNGTWAAWVPLANGDYTSLSNRYVLRTTTVSIAAGTSAFSGLYASGGSVTVGSYAELVAVSLTGIVGWMSSWSYSGTTLTVNAYKVTSSAITATVHYFTR